MICTDCYLWGKKNMKKRLGDIATYVNGYAFKPSDRGLEGLPIIRIQDLTGNSYDLGYYNGTYPSKIEINDGDVLISWSASLGIYVWDRGKALLNQHIFKVLFDKIEINKWYFVFSVKYKLQEMELKTHGATMKHIVKKDFDNILIPFPTLEKQNNIASILLKIKKIIIVRQQQLDDLDKLVKARFVEMFGTVKENPYNFPTATLKEVCHKITDGKHGGCEQEANSGYYYIGAREIYDGAIHYDTAPQITYADFTKDYRRCNIEQGDMVIVNTGATIGKSAIAVSSLTERTLLQKSVALLKVKTDMVSAEFLRYCYMANPSMYMVKSASAQPNLLLSKMNATVIYLPPRELQEQFADFVAQTDKSKLFVNAYFILIFCCLRCIINTSVKK